MPRALLSQLSVLLQEQRAHRVTTSYHAAPAVPAAQALEGANRALVEAVKSGGPAADPWAAALLAAPAGAPGGWGRPLRMAAWLGGTAEGAALMDLVVVEVGCKL